MKILDNINSPEDLKKLSNSQCRELSGEIRDFLIDSVSKTGGHLASNLGVVELTIALHRIFESPEDKIVWDVGHQCYVHKILTGRRKDFAVLRKFGGLSGFPKASESEHDVFDTGHSSTSISVALGYAYANRMNNKTFSSVAVIGDGALTGGLAFEALNNAGRSKTNLIVVLNDNEMSISKNVGGLSTYLNRLRSQLAYLKFKKIVQNFLDRIPILGDVLAKIFFGIKNFFKHLVLPGTLFEELGFVYLGPIDGHNLENLELVFKRAKRMNRPVFIHVYTKKGKGYKYAEKDPGVYHGISKFDKDKPFCSPMKACTYSSAFGKKLVELAAMNEKLVAITASMKVATGLSEFANRFGRRFFDVGIAEQHAVTFAAGLSKAGFIPVVALYSSFAQRAYDNILHDVAIQNLHVVICLDRAGLVGEDGETHQGIFDVSFLSHIPNLKILTPATKQELDFALEYAVEKQSGPIVIRYPKGSVESSQEKQGDPLKAKILSQGNKLTVVSMGRMTKVVAEAIRLSNQSVEHISLKSVKPLDMETIINSCNKTKRLLTVEDDVLSGGMGSGILEQLSKRRSNISVKLMGIDDKFVVQGKVEVLLKDLGLCAAQISEEIIKECHS